MQLGTEKSLFVSCRLRLSVDAAFMDRASASPSTAALNEDVMTWKALLPPFVQ